SRRTVPFEANAAVNVESRAILFVSAHLIALSGGRACNQRSVKRRPYLSAVRMPAEIQINRKLFNRRHDLRGMKKQHCEQILSCPTQDLYRPFGIDFLSVIAVDSDKL